MGSMCPAGGRGGCTLGVLAEGRAGAAVGVRASALGLEEEVEGAQAWAQADIEEPDETGAIWAVIRVAVWTGEPCRLPRPRTIPPSPWGMRAK
jgi:hypothetical protein